MEINILAESVIKIEAVKKEPEEIEHNSWNSNEEDKPSFLQYPIKEENNVDKEELEQPFAVLVEPDEKYERLCKEEKKDPLAPCYENAFVSSIKQEDGLLDCQFHSTKKKERRLTVLMDCVVHSRPSYGSYIICVSFLSNDALSE